MTRLGMLSIVVGLACVANAADSPTPQPGADFAARIAELESQVAELQVRPLPTAQLPSLQPRLWDLYGGGWYGGAEATILEPFMSGAPAIWAVDNESGSLINQQFAGGVRYQVGWANEAGLGIRGRYWSYYNFFAQAEPFAPAQLGIDLQAADLEATVTQRVWNWDTLLAAGARYGKLRYMNDVRSIFGAGSAAFEGVGPTLALEGRRRLGGSAFSLYGNVRGSALFGTIANDALLLNMPAATPWTSQGEVMGVAENQLGIVWDRVLKNGLVVEARAVWETQYWMNSTLSDDTYGIGTNLGLIGPTIGVLLCY